MGGGVKPEYLIAAIKHQELKRNLGIPLDVTVLLSVGEVNVNKNHKVVIEALPELKSCWYVLCGRGPLMDEHRKVAERLGVSDRFVMTGYRTDVADFYRMADVFVFPSYREGLPVSVMEAMAAGLPVICTDIRGNEDLIDNERGGYLFEATNRGVLAERLNRLLASPIDMDDFGYYNKQSIQNYDINNVSIKIKQLYLDT